MNRSTLPSFHFISEREVQRFGGHAKPSMTLDVYVGEFEVRKCNDVGERLSAAFSRVL